MAACPACGKENPEGFQFCGFCTAPLTGESREQRKTVTVLFCDVTGSTALGESTDPEALRALLARYFDRMRGIVESYGGTVEKFIGDAVMAVFGVPVAHEDDALRACLAAVEMREALPELGIAGRIGVMTGEVVTGTDERLATGDAVSVGARLQQAAEPGEILVGVETVRHTRDAAEVEPVEPLTVKGKVEPVPAFRLLSVSREGLERRLDAPMVGRETELRALADAFDQTVRDGCCQLFTIVGAAGVGKSRLVAGFLESLKEATVVRGRCLPYGEGITYWPVVEVVKQLPDPPEGSLDERAAATIRSLLDEQSTPTTSEEIAWSFRKLLEAVSQERPLVCVYDDVQWGEETFLDLIEHVAYLSRSGPILLLCMTRPDLLDGRPGWGASLRIRPLDADESNRLLEQRLAGSPVEPALQERILAAADGNPLFLEEMGTMLLESDDKDVSVPPTIQALLSARLDQLDAAERAVLERGAVEGELFHRSAVQALAPAEQQLTTRLTALVRKELIRPATPQIPGEDAFRFHHLLFRDAAYDSLAKSTRAELHERFTAWLEEHGRDLVELDELRGYHLEQACRYMAELGRSDDDTREQAARAASSLAAAGGRALARGDYFAAANLLDRMLLLLPPGKPERRAVLADLGYALQRIGDLARADAVLRSAIDDSMACDDRRLEVLARLRSADLLTHTKPEGSLSELLRAAEQALPVFERLGDERGLTEAWMALAKIHANACRFGLALDALGHALPHARRAGAPRLEKWILADRAAYSRPGRMPLREVVHAYQEALVLVEGDIPLSAGLGLGLARTKAMLGHYAEARDLERRSWTMLEELAPLERYASYAPASGSIYLLVGDPASAEERLRWAYGVLAAKAEKGVSSTVAALLAEALYAQVCLEEAERFARVSEETAAGDDVATQVWWRGTRAKVLARSGQNARAETLAREAVALASDTDSLELQGSSLMDLAEVLRLADRHDNAVPVAQEALRLHEHKGNVVSAAKARSLLAELRQAVSKP